MIRKFLPVLFWALTLQQRPLLAQDRVRADSLFSVSLSRTMHLSVLLPSGYEGQKKYPLLFLLHGWGGNERNWLDFTSLVSDPESDSLIIVMPQADNSWYVNSMAVRSERYEDYLIGDLERFVRSRYSVDTARESIAGLSMGGYGALVLGLRHPDRFHFIGVLSGSLDVPGRIDEMEKLGRGILVPSLRRAFGASRTPLWDDDDPFKLIGRITRDSLPYIYLVTGIQEPYTGRLLLYRAFADSLRIRNDPYEYHETPGVHDFRFWGREIRPLLKRLQETNRKQSY